MIAKILELGFHDVKEVIFKKRTGDSDTCWYDITLVVQPRSYLSEEPTYRVELGHMWGTSRGGPTYSGYNLPKITVMGDEEELEELELQHTAERDMEQAEFQAEAQRDEQMLRDGGTKGGTDHD